VLAAMPLGRMAARLAWNTTLPAARQHFAVGSPARGLMQGRQGASPRTMMAASFYDLPPVKDIDGNDFMLDQLKGKVVYANNVASR